MCVSAYPVATLQSSGRLSHGAAMLRGALMTGVAGTLQFLLECGISRLHRCETSCYRCFGLQAMELAVKRRFLTG